MMRAKALLRVPAVGDLDRLKAMYILTKTDDWKSITKYGLWR